MNKFKTLCNLLENMKNPKEARDQIADYLKELSPEDQIIACNFMLGKPLENDAVGYSKKIAESVIFNELGYDKNQKYETLGDVFNDNDTSLNNNLIETYKSYYHLYQNTKNKIDVLDMELSFYDCLEKKYFINILLNKLRVRIGMGVLSWSLAEIYDVDNKYINNLYRKYESMIDVIEILNGGSDELVIGQPVKPMLAKDVAKYV